MILSPADLAEAKRSVGAEGMHLIGFRSAAEIGRHLQLSKPARFMYPEVWTWGRGRGARPRYVIGLMVKPLFSSERPATT